MSFAALRYAMNMTPMLTCSLSVGQRQLLSLAQVLLKKKKILLFDEPTASVDSATEGEIAQVVHNGFKGSTMLIIAHHLRTVMTCDKIIVMDKGRIIQQGTPSMLFQEDGKFAELCAAGGLDEYKALQNIANQAAIERQRDTSTI